MVRRRKPLGPLGYLKKEARRAAREMMPHRVAWRVFGPGTQFPSKRTLKRKYGTRTVQVTAQTRQQDVQRVQVAAARAAKKAATKKAAGKRPDPYAAALAIPGQNRAVAAKQAAAVKAASTPRKQVAKRKADGSGQFDGSRLLNDRDRAAWQNALNGTVDPSLAPRSARTRRT